MKGGFGCNCLKECALFNRGWSRFRRKAIVQSWAVWIVKMSWTGRPLQAARCVTDAEKEISA